VAQDGARAEESDVDAAGLRGVRGVALGERPALVVAEREQRPVPEQDAGVLLDRLVGRVAHVEAVLLDEAHQRVLAAEEVARPVAVRVGAVEGDDPSPGAQRVHAGGACAAPCVEVVAAVVVPRLPGVYVVLHEVGGPALEVGDCEGHVASLAARADEFEEVVALDEARRHLEPQRRSPVVAGDHVGRRRPGARRLPAALEVSRAPDEPRALALVPAHPVGVDPEAARPGRDVERDLLPLDRVGARGEARDPPGPPRRDLPGGRPRERVLLDDPARSHAVGEAGPGGSGLHGRLGCRGCPGRS
jgi:hypothetical protein